LACLNFDKHQPIQIIFGRGITEKLSITRWLVFLSHLNNPSAKPEKTKKHENRIFHSNDELRLCLGSINHCL